jgi:hypothetical protein
MLKRTNERTKKRYTHSWCICQELLVGRIVNPRRYTMHAAAVGTSSRKGQPLARTVRRYLLNRRRYNTHGVINNALPHPTAYEV